MTVGDFHQWRKAITLDEYRALDKAGEITRPLTLGPMQRRMVVSDAIEVLDMAGMGIRPASDAARNRKHRERRAA